MRFFLFEFITGGGSETTPSGSLLTEGLAMATALVDDFSRVPNAEVVTTIDVRLAQHPSVASFQTVSRRRNVTCLPVEHVAHPDLVVTQFTASDFAMVVAPEFDGILTDMTRLATDSGTQLLCPSLESVQRFSSKDKTSKWLRLHQIPAPQGRTITSLDQVDPNAPLPFVVKPDDGAGSIGVQRIATQGTITFR